MAFAMTQDGVRPTDLAICEKVSLFSNILVRSIPEIIRKGVCEVAASFLSCFNHYYILYYYLYYVSSLEVDKVFHNNETF